MTIARTASPWSWSTKRGSRSFSPREPIRCASGSRDSSSAAWRARFEPQTATIVGVVADVRYSGLDKNPEPVVYFVDSQRAALRRSYVVTSADGHPEKLIPQIRAALKQLDPQVPLQFETMANVVTASLVWSRLGVLLMGTFGVVSLVLVGHRGIWRPGVRGCAAPR